MSVSEKCHSRHIGFSTGALERGDYWSALSWMCKNHIDTVELSALRIDELEPLVQDLNRLPVNAFSYVSFHAPSWFEAGDEIRVVELLEPVFHRGWNIVVHPDVIRKPALWRRFGSQLLLENMDRRKATGRTADELDLLFVDLPEARLCLDVAHARQLDTTLTVLAALIQRFWKRIAEVHISELDSFCQHRLMSKCAVSDYQGMAWRRLSSSTPVIIESMLEGKPGGLRHEEYLLACTAAHRSCHSSRPGPATSQ